MDRFLGVLNSSGLLDLVDVVLRLSAGLLRGYWFNYDLFRLATFFYMFYEDREVSRLFTVYLLHAACYV